MNDWSEPFNQKEFEEVLKPFMVLKNDELNKSPNDKSIIYVSSNVRKDDNINGYV